MNYNIENFEVIKNKEDKCALEKKLEQFVNKISYIPKKYINSDKIDVVVKENNDSYVINMTSFINNKSLGCSEIVKDFSKLNIAFDRFYEKIDNELEIARASFSKNKKNSFINAINIEEKNLENLNENQKNTLFKSLITSTLPDMIGYIKRRVYSARMANIKVFNSIFVKDVVSEVIIRVYDIFKNNLKNIKDFNLWNIQESDEVLNEILEEENFSSTEVSYEQLVNRELDELEENYSIDGNGDFMMTEELDEEFMPPVADHKISILNSYMSDKDVIEIIEKSDNELNDNIFVELIKLPLKYQSIYDLYYFEQMEIEDIAKIKNMSPIEIEAILISIRELIAENS